VKKTSRGGVVVNLDEVDARPLQVGHRFPGLLRVGHAAAIRVPGRGIVPTRGDLLLGRGCQGQQPGPKVRVDYMVK
jgi:hypothetical protein